MADKCPNCGYSLKVVPGNLMVACESCGTEIEIAAFEEEIIELDFNEYLKKVVDEKNLEEITIIECKNCGAESRFEKGIVAGECNFCNAPVNNASIVTHRTLKPSNLLPFSVDNSKGINSYKIWMKSLWFAPNDLSKLSSNSGKLTPVFLPYWTFDAKTKSNWTGYKIVKKDKGSSSYYRSGKIAKNFDDLTIVASKLLPEKYLDALEPWDLEALIPYDENFLRGIQVESYRITLPEGWERAKHKMEESLKKAIKKEIGGDQQKITSLKTQHSDITFKHILLPVFVSVFFYREKKFVFMINGRTGEVQGQRPYSKMKIFLFILLILSMIAGGIYSFSYFSEPFHKFLAGAVALILISAVISFPLRALVKSG